MNILPSKLLIQALAQRTQAKLSRCKRACCLVSTPASCCSREDQCTALADRVEIVRLEGSDGKLGEREGGADVRVKCFCDLLVCDLQERLPYAVPCIEDSHPQRVRRGGPMLLDCGKGRGERGSIISWHGEWSCLQLHMLSESWAIRKLWMNIPHRQLPLLHPPSS